MRSAPSPSWLRAVIFDFAGTLVDTAGQWRAAYDTVYPYLQSTRAELLRRLGRLDEARSAYERALALVRTGHERAFLRGRLQEI